MNEYRTPTRWPCYVAYGLMIVLLCAQAPLPVALVWHQVMEGGIVGGALGVIGWWRWRSAATVRAAADLQTLHRYGLRPISTTTAQAAYMVAQARHTKEQ